ncbi:hypothetical protein OG21DRAFT_1605805 [Imleria badia]|nr:hypothetical protein OG21DRAFT_1605805 [Imleria badia]
MIVSKFPGLFHWHGLSNQTGPVIGSIQVRYAEKIMSLDHSSPLAFERQGFIHQPWPRKQNPRTEKADRGHPGELHECHLPVDDDGQTRRTPTAQSSRDTPSKAWASSNVRHALWRRSDPWGNSRIIPSVNGGAHVAGPVSLVALAVAFQLVYGRA